jgi:hypothetical protein
MTLYCLRQVVLTANHRQITVAAGGTLANEGGSAAQCAWLADKYITLSASYRATTTTGGEMAPGTAAHGDCATSSASGTATGVGGGGWYRLSGASGDALPLAPPGPGHCGTGWAGWLTGWDASIGPCYSGNPPPCPQDSPSATSGGRSSNGPPLDYSTHGRYPSAAEGVVDMTVCFDFLNSRGHGGPCDSHGTVGVLRCRDFLLWRLPYTADCEFGYCTAPSGLFGKSGASG